VDTLLTSEHLRLRALAEEVTRDSIAPRSSEVDERAEWPAHSLEALADAGLLGLHVPTRFGGREQGLLALAVISESIARGCASSALCYGMHCVGSAVITAKATRYHEERYLEPIARGEHLTTLALSESGTGAHFYLPQTRLERVEDDFIVDGVKQFITNGSHADSYVVSTRATSDVEPAGDFSCLVVDAETPGVEWLEPWRGFGMRGNASRGLRLDGVRVPGANLLGEEGDQVWYVFEVVAPYFLIAMAGTYAGVAQAALDIALHHLRHRTYDHAESGLADVQLLQHRAATLSAAVIKTRGLVYHAALLGDAADASAATAIMLAKAEAAETAVNVANEAMTICGGRAYRDNSELARVLRDARAGHVMAPTTDILRTWAGRALLGQPLL
jgi:alkylation response protein AidB-like acyl-CoA dehydrogenase